MPGLVLTNSMHKDASAGAARGLSAAAGAGVSVIQPTPGLFVGPTGDSKARRGRHTLAGTTYGHATHGKLNVRRALTPPANPRERADLCATSPADRCLISWLDVMRANDLL